MQESNYNFDYYFPMPNDLNEERLTYLMERALMNAGLRSISTSSRYDNFMSSKCYIKFKEIISSLPDSVLYIINRVMINREGRIILGLNHKKYSELKTTIEQRKLTRYSLIIYLTGGIKLAKRKVATGDGYTSITDYLKTNKELESSINDFINGKI